MSASHIPTFSSRLASLPAGSIPSSFHTTIPQTTLNAAAAAAASWNPFGCVIWWRREGGGKACSSGYEVHHTTRCVIDLWEPSSVWSSLSRGRNSSESPEFESAGRTKVFSGAPTMESRRTGKCKGLLVSIILFGVILSGKVDAKILIIGDKPGWTNTVPDYSTWASAQTIEVRDQLVFTYARDKHNVHRFESQASYDACDFSNAISIGLSNEQNCTWIPVRPGVYYFGCSVASPGGGTHCELGQKVSLTVVSASAVPVPSPQPSLPPSLPGPAPAPVSNSSASAPAPVTNSSTPSPTPAPGPGPKAPAPSPKYAPAPTPKHAPAPTPRHHSHAPAPAPFLGPPASPMGPPAPPEVCRPDNPPRGGSAGVSVSPSGWRNLLALASALLAILHFL